MNKSIKHKEIKFTKLSAIYFSEVKLVRKTVRKFV